MSTYNKAALLGGRRVKITPNTEANRQYAAKKILRAVGISRKTYNRAVRAMSYMPRRAPDTPKGKRTKHPRNVPIAITFNGKRHKSSYLKRKKSGRKSGKRKSTNNFSDIVFPS